MAAITRREPGNVSYDFYRGLEDPSRTVILESYQDAEDFDRHRESQHFLDVGVRQIIPWLVSRLVSTYTYTSGHQATRRRLIMKRQTRLSFG